MTKYLKNVACLALMLLTWSEVGCGLDARRQESPNVSSPPSKPEKPMPPSIPVAVPSNAIPTFTLEWFIDEATDLKRTLNRSILLNNIGYRSFRVDPPITLPWAPQDSIEITISDLPVKPKTSNTKLKPTIKVAPTSTSASSVELSVTPNYLSYKETSQGITDIHFTASGLTKLFNPSFEEEEKININLELSSGETDADKIRIDFVLMTPPSRVVFNQRPLKEYEAAFKPISEDLKYFESDSKKLSLIQVVEIQDLSDQPISVVLPSKLTGKLWQKSTWTDPQYDAFSKAMCFDQPKTIETTEVYSTAFILLPLGPDLPSNWGAMIQNEANPLNVPPRETKLFGIYAIPTQNYDQDFKTLLKRRDPQEFARSNPIETVLINTQCNFGCTTFNLAETFKNQCSSIPSYFQSDCNKRVASCLSCFSGQGGPSAKQTHCNECFEKEVMETPSYIAQYKGELACVSGWTKTVLKTKQAPKGTQLGSMFFEIQSQDTLADIRYGNLPQAQDPESRLIFILNSSITQE